jgi:hypothetical protein
MPNRSQSSKEDAQAIDRLKRRLIVLAFENRARFRAICRILYRLVTDF